MTVPIEPGRMERHRRIVVSTHRSPGADLEHMQMVAAPPEQDLNHRVQVTERDDRGYQHPPPDVPGGARKYGTNVSIAEEELYADLPAVLRLLLDNPPLGVTH